MDDKAQFTAETTRENGFNVGTTTTRFQVQTMHCRSCVSRIETALKEIPGVVSAHVELDSRTVDVGYQPNKTNLKDIFTAVRLTGHEIAGRPSKEQTTETAGQMSPSVDGGTGGHYD